MKHFKLLIIVLILSLNNYAQPVLPFPEILEIESWSGSQWAPGSTTDYTFNVNCLYTLSVTQTSTGENFFRAMGTYIDDLYPDEFIFQIWDSVNNEWNNIARADYFNIDNVLQDITSYNWLGNQWVEGNKQLFMINNDDLITEYIFQNWDPINNDWINLSKTEYTYLPNNTEDIRTTYEWNDGTQQWDLEERDLHNYTDGLLDFIQIESWDSNQWNNGRYEEFSYDTDDLLIEWVLSDWDNGSYVNHSRRLYSDFYGGYPETMISQSWQNGDWLNTSRESRVYPDCLNLSIEGFTKDSVLLYPNPTNDYVNISITENAEFSLISIQGQELLKGNFIEGENIVNIESLSNGIYMLNIKSKQGKISKKIIKN